MNPRKFINIFPSLIISLGFISIFYPISHSFSAPVCPIGEVRPYCGNNGGSCDSINSCGISTCNREIPVSGSCPTWSFDIKANNSDGPITVSPGQVTIDWNYTGIYEGGCFILQDLIQIPVGSGPDSNGSYVYNVSSDTSVSIECTYQGPGYGSSIDTVDILVSGTPGPTPTGSVTPTPTPSPTPGPGGLSCSPYYQTVTLGSPATVDASGGTPGYNWSTADGTPTNGSGPSFTTTYNSTPGVHEIYLGDNSGTGFQPICYVESTISSTPPPILRYACHNNGLCEEDPAGSFTSPVCNNTCPGGPTPTPTPTPTPNPPSVPNASIITPDYCTTGPATTVTWTYSDPSGLPQLAYQVQVDDQSSFSAPEVDSGKILNNGTSYYTGQGYLAFNTTYRARVRVWNSSDVVSNWTTSNTWKTPKHAYPSVSFGWLPTTPKISQIVQFTDYSIFDDSGGSGKRAWSWLFGDGDSSASQNPTDTYSSSGNYIVNETVTDKDGYSCSLSQTLSVQRGVPIWKEVSPQK